VGHPTNPENEIIVRGYFNSEEVSMVRKSEFSWTAGAKVPGQSGDYAWTFQAYVQNRREARSLRSAIERLIKKNAELQIKYSESVNPEEKESIMAEIQKNEGIIEQSKALLEKGRRGIGRPLELEIRAN
jgi:hypothetical protein